MTHFRRVLGFALIPLMTMASTLLVLPLISSRFGPEGWSAVGLGQSLGAFLSIVAGLAWPVVGAQQIASSVSEERRVIYAESIKSRGLIFIVLLPVASVLCFAFAPGYKWECVAFMVATALNCFNASWFFAGTGQPRYVIRNEALVRLIGYLLSIPAIILTNSLWAYAALLIISGVVMGLANALSIFNVFSGEVWSKSRGVAQIVREHLFGGVSRLFSAGHQHLGITVVSILTPQVLPAYTALDNMQKSINNATSFYPQAFAWWVGSPKDSGVRNRRIRFITLLTLIMGAVVFSTWLIVGPLIMRWLYHGQADIDFVLHLWTAGGMATYTVSRALGQLSLVPLALQAAVYRGASVCAVIGLPGLGVGLWFGGIGGALAVTSVAYGGLCVFYLLTLAIALRGSDQRAMAPLPDGVESE